MSHSLNSDQSIQVAPLTGLVRKGSWEAELAHERNQHLLVWITRGQGRALMNGSRRGFGTHNALFIPAGSLTAFEFGRNCLGQVMFVKSTNAISLPHRPFHFRISNSAEQANLTSLLDAMQKEQDLQSNFFQRAMQAYGELVGVLLQRQIPVETATKPRRSAAQRLTQAYCARISKFHRENFSMGDHASALGVTATHLNRAVKTQTGTTAASLLTERQLHAARCLLIESDLPIREISSELNFNSAAYFTRFITQHTGQSPSGLRKLAQL